ncbi:hypothetical protein JCM5296_003818 [Sporobolomyces johnsonii]
MLQPSRRSKLAAEPAPSPSPSSTRAAPRLPAFSSLSRSKPLEFMIMGSGGSAAVPNIACTTDPAHGCACCLDTVPGGGGQGRRSKNIRGNTSGVLRVPQENGEEKTILLDCGKTFREAALKWFPTKGLRRIDACILTHHHADAIDGLDDLRAWTSRSAIEQTIPIYCTEVTYAQISAGFTYLVNKKAASGSGALPSFDWHIMPDDQDWEICGVTITPIPVHHGHYFNKGPPRPPLICLGFLIDSSMLYISDASYIPEDTWNRLAHYVALPTQTGLFPSSVRHLPRLQALIIDCTGLRRGPSHFGLPQAIATSRRLGAIRTYLTDLPHRYTHAAWLAFCDAFGRGARHSLAATENGLVGRAVPAWKVRDEFEQQPGAADVYAGLDPRVEDRELFVERALEAVEGWAGGVLPGRWVRPLVDGMTVCCERDDDGNEWARERVWDDEYE